MRGARLVPLVAVFAVATLLSGCAWIARVDPPVPGTGADPNFRSVHFWTSNTGRYVVFDSLATNLVKSTLNNDPVFQQSAVYLRDNKAKKTTLLHLNASLGTDAVLSKDVRFVLMQLLEDGAPWVVLDRTTGTFEHVNVDSNGAPLDGNVRSATISADGRFVALRLYTGNISTYIRDRQTHTTKLLTKITPTAGNVFFGYFTDALSLSSDGSMLSQGTCITSEFVHGTPDCTSWNLQVWDVTNTAVTTPFVDQSRPFAARLDGDGHLVVYWDGTHIWAYSRPTHTRTLVDLGYDGQPASGSTPSVSTNGRYVSFESEASNLSPWVGNPAGKTHVYVRDLAGPTTALADVSAIGPYPGGGWSYWGSISGDGRYVTFESTSSYLTPDATTYTDRMYVKAVFFPSIVSVTPGSVPAGTTRHLTVAGSGFRPDIQVLVRNDTTVVATSNVATTETSLQMDVTVPLGAPTGSYDVYVYNPGGGPGQDTGAATSCPHCLQVTAPVPG
ncbi:MAG: IPT/TIG domain-containing protein [Acidimicrobiia bacterium]